MIFFNTLTFLAFPICGSCNKSGANSVSCVHTDFDLTTGNHLLLEGFFG